ncbi:MAG: DoxX family membrane protein [Gordonia sp. (in: high G+C Gram-positive bacteria)]|uniref:DoxX family membrane protein n=1 Tax=Gordonia sp. (in: high G+C Gram-positive bacteria) TaxID=84139 RepID=UPI003BB5CE51
MILRKIARPLLATAFIASGADLLRAKPAVAATVQPMVDTGRQALPDQISGKLPANASTAMRVAGVVQVGGGILLATGKAPRLASAALATTLIPVTVYDGAFWTETDPVRREARKVGLIKNVGLLGGVLIATADTEGKPSAAWRAQHAVAEAQFAANIAAKEASLAGSVSKRRLKKAAKSAAKASLRSHGHPAVALALPLAARVGSTAVHHVHADASEERHELAERASDAADKVWDKAELAAVQAKAKAPIVAAKVRNRADEAAEQFAHRAPILVDEAKVRAEHLATKAKEQAPVVAEKAREGAEVAKERAEEVTREVRKRWRDRQAS